MKLEEDKEIIDYIYKIRYYKYIYINEKQQIKDIESLNQQLDEVLKALITKACKKSKIKIISLDININFKIIKEILDTKIMNLDDIRIEMQNNNGNLRVIVYENEVYEKDFELEENFSKKEIALKMNKPIKLFS